MYNGVKASNMGDFDGLGKLSKTETAVREKRWDWGALDQSQSWRIEELLVAAIPVAQTTRNIHLYLF